MTIPLLFKGRLLYHEPPNKMIMETETRFIKTKSIRSRMNRNIAMLIFLLLTGIAGTIVHKVRAADLPETKGK
jgi:hypothetical protein